jgi:glycerophosphoryl diester phosphodiesterase
MLTPQREIAAALADAARRDPPPETVVPTADFELPGVVRCARRYGLAHVSMGLGRRTWGDFRDEVDHVVRARRRGRVESVVAWTVNDEDRLRDLAALGVDGIITDDPSLLRRLLGDR